MAVLNNKPAKNEIALSIIIVSWNVCDLLCGCLDSLWMEIEADPSLTTEVIVVDNASYDHSQELVRSQYPWVHLIENKENIGFAQANNQAIKRSLGKYVLLLNPDTEVMPESLNKLVEFMEIHPEAGMAGARLLNSNGTLQHSCFQEPTLFREFWQLFHLDALIPIGVYRMEKWDLENPREVDALLGACMLAPREIINQIGHLEEGYFMYSEEIDFCTRIREAGWRIYWVPKIQVIHHGKGSSRRVADEMFLQLYRSKKQYLCKHKGESAGLWFKIILGAAAVARLALIPFIFFETPKKRNEHLRLSKRYWRLLLEIPNL